VAPRSIDATEDTATNASPGDRKSRTTWHRSTSSLPSPTAKSRRRSRCSPRTEVRRESV